jgi:transcriptional regulator with XRE-family HTH domain
VPLDPLPDWVLTRRRAIGGRIRDARERANLTQWTLGEAIGRDNKTVLRFEYALSVPTLTDLLLIADACGTTVADLLAE